MRKFILLALLGLAVPACAKHDLSAAAAWRETCDLSRYTCTGVRPPTVRESVFVEKAGAYGLYMGGKTIWLAPSLTEAEKYVIMVHEMTHYLQVHEDGSKMQTFESCFREEEAYEVSDRVLKRLGVKSLKPMLDLLRQQCA